MTMEKLKKLFSTSTRDSKTSLPSNSSCQVCYKRQQSNSSRRPSESEQRIKRPSLIRRFVKSVRNKSKSEPRKKINHKQPSKKNEIVKVKIDDLELLALGEQDNDEGGSDDGADELFVDAIQAEQVQECGNYYTNDLDDNDNDDGGGEENDDNEEQEELEIELLLEGFIEEYQNQIDEEEINFDHHSENATLSFSSNGEISCYEDFCQVDTFYETELCELPDCPDGLPEIGDPDDYSDELIAEISDILDQIEILLVDDDNDLTFEGHQLFENFCVEDIENFDAENLDDYEQNNCRIDDSIFEDNYLESSTGMSISENDEDDRHYQTQEIDLYQIESYESASVSDLSNSDTIEHSKSDQQLLYEFAEFLDENLDPDQENLEIEDLLLLLEIFDAQMENLKEDEDNDLSFANDIQDCYKDECSELDVFDYYESEDFECGSFLDFE